MNRLIILYRWLQHQWQYRLYDYRFFKLKHLRHHKPDAILENALYALSILDDFDYPAVEAATFKRILVESKVSDITTLHSILKDAYRSLYVSGEIIYNRRLIGTDYQIYNAMDWMWRPLMEEELSIDSMMNRVTSLLHSLITTDKVNGIEISATYRIRATLPLIDAYISLLEVIETIYLENVR